MKTILNALGRVSRSLPMLVTVLMLGLVVEASATDFCWRDSYGRGAGKIPKGGCGPGQDHIGALCYDKCPAGMKRFGFDCHSVCPPGFKNQGLFCRKAEYGRGAGVPWRGGDTKKNHRQQHRCEAKYGKGNCERTGAIWYQKCRPGYHKVGCCICRPSKPDCRALGLKRGIDLSCAKRVKIGKPKGVRCGTGFVKSAGLCYKKCRPGFNGVGPVCWAQPPVASWVKCGMGAAKDKKTCRSAITDQIMSVGEVALNVATLGTSAAATETANVAENAGRLAELRKEYQRMKDLWEEAKQIKEVKTAVNAAEKTKEVGEFASNVYGAEQEAEGAVTAEDMARVAAMIAAIVDPTGVSGIAASYTYPKCSKLFRKR